MPDDRDARRGKLRLAPSSAAPEVQERAEAERRVLEQELELAHARRDMRRALVTKLVEEYKTRPMQIRLRSLRSALVERDESEEQCDALERAVDRVLKRSNVLRHPRNSD